MRFPFVLFIVSALAFGGCHPQTPPTDGGAAPPSWVPAATVSLTIAEAGVETAEGLEAQTGLQGSDLSDYDAALHGAHDALASILDHVLHGTDPCTLHADAARAVDLFQRIATILANHNVVIPPAVVNGAGRLVGLLEATVFPQCLAADAGAPALASRLRASYAGANIARAVPARLEAP